ncbi:hypothetical protein HNQ41_001322 [Texcoconibacillus texcoconensis]|uniref:Uncharacterized protein n=1 Tax=Texcoconibacillus texcoconensis TaxID=1095777 RepID=A0A840QP97_9BACI|nr:hypothetical protein [Texcoconibacillus texcoconensis]
MFFGMNAGWIGFLYMTIYTYKPPFLYVQVKVENIESCRRDFVYIANAPSYDGQILLKESETGEHPI